MTNTALLSVGWTWNASVLLTGLAAITLYARTKPRPHPSQGTLFGLTMLLFFLTLLSPFNWLAEKYLFSAHMLQHLLLLMVIPLLILLSWPRMADDPRHRRTEFILGRWASHPLPAWLAGVGGMWFWHIPTVCDAASVHPLLRDGETLSLLLLGLWFWWPIFSPRWTQRLPDLQGIPYLFSACVGCTLLGIIISFTPTPVCSVFRHPTDSQGMLSLIRNQWGLTPPIDQQIGGLMMWIPACLVYVFVILRLLLRWYATPEPLHATTQYETAESRFLKTASYRKVL